MTNVVFVMAPESSGSRGTTQFLIDNGYWGTSDHIQPLDQFIYGQNQLHEVVPEGTQNIVFRRSIPHAKQFPDLYTIDTLFLNAGCRTRWLIVIRNLTDAMRSKIVRNHVLDENQAMLNALYEYQWMLSKVLNKTSGCYFFPFDYLKFPKKAKDYLISLEIL